MTLGEKILLLRKQNNMTQEQLAERLAIGWGWLVQCWLLFCIKCSFPCVGQSWGVWAAVGAKKPTP